MPERWDQMAGHRIHVLFNHSQPGMDRQAVQQRDLMG